MPLLSYDLSPAAAATATVATRLRTVAVKIGERGRAELADGKCHLAEQTARIAFFVYRALLIGHTILGRAHQVLRRALDANDRENTKRNEERIAVIIAVQRPGDSRSNPRRDLIAATSTAAIASRLRNTHGQKDGIDDLNDRSRKIGGIVIGIAKIARTDRRITAINTYVANATVKHDPLFHHGNAAKFLISAEPHAGFQLDLDIKADGNLIKALIKADGIDADIGPKDLTAVGANRCGVFNDLLAVIREKNADILVAISVAAGVKHTERIDTDGFPIPTQAEGRGAASIIRHCGFPLT